MAALIWFGVFAVSVMAWFTHVITCFNEGLWGFLVAGAIMFPVAIVHGIYLWMH